MELSDLRKGDHVEIMLPEESSGTSHRWYKAEVVSELHNDDLGEAVELLVFPADIFGCDYMRISSTKYIRKCN